MNILSYYKDNFGMEQDFFKPGYRYCRNEKKMMDPMTPEELRFFGNLPEKDRIKAIFKARPIISKKDQMTQEIEDNARRIARMVDRENELKESLEREMAKPEGVTERKVTITMAEYQVLLAKAGHK